MQNENALQLSPFENENSQELTPSPGVVVDNIQPTQEQMVVDLPRLEQRYALQAAIAFARIPHGGHQYKLTNNAMVSLAAYYAVMGDSAYWIDADDQDVTLSKTDVEAILAKMKTATEEIYRQYNADRAAA